ncbi:DOPA 4,5-dioxygenase family protein [Bradyrhizobium sp. HKCCYLRH2015]|uniref:DOPA 4,5-dioxygenase family protein n=1 Tax=unclassified Bradyrhizobium TaxID=2631580 RepID=UPI0029167A0C|nr:DOPA 4,5-dioxygenase family protein [Bradyrhizobium sp. SZCCHNR1015]
METTSAAQPHRLSAIASFHAHIYFDDATRTEAAQLRQWMADRFLVTLGRWHDALVGPHERPMYQVAFAVDVFPVLVSWLMLNHGRLSVLVHPNTTEPLADHTAHALWIGSPLGIRSENLPSHGEAELAREPNTTPTIAA